MDNIELEIREKELLDELDVELEKLNKKLLEKLEERKMDSREIAIVNRGKVAYLYCNNKFEDRVEKIVRNGQEMWAFIYKLDKEIQKLLDKYDENVELKRYNASFKHVALAVKKCKAQE